MIPSELEWYLSKEGLSMILKMWSSLKSLTTDRYNVCIVDYMIDGVVTYARC